ncbi:hypothetical protein ElP_49290 [Tautonia plasticadhaerens]|uniref:Uncharacterized protein n=1 Tax=Tautonia plasticadhaerens TaxID=2527974 RepID=A0A518H808_9BACT|nr:hypothetical protein ElP_49290 [Tautonia plasticadhaerens]
MHPPGTAERLRAVRHLRHRAVRDVPRVGEVRPRHDDQAPRGAVGLARRRVLRVDYGNAIHVEPIPIRPGGHGAEVQLPDALAVPLHRPLVGDARDVAADEPHRVGRIGPEAECHAPVLLHIRRGGRRGLPLLLSLRRHGPPGRGEHQEHHPGGGSSIHRTSPSGQVNGRLRSGLIRPERPGASGQAMLPRHPGLGDQPPTDRCRREITASPPAGTRMRPSSPNPSAFGTTRQRPAPGQRADGWHKWALMWMTLELPVLRSVPVSIEPVASDRRQAGPDRWSQRTHSAVRSTGAFARLARSHVDWSSRSAAIGLIRVRSPAWQRLRS